MCHGGTLLCHDDNGLPSGRVIKPQLNAFSSKSCLVMPALHSIRTVAKTECLQQNEHCSLGFSVYSVSLFFLHSLIAPQVPKPSSAECQENMTRVPKEERQTATGETTEKRRPQSQEPNCGNTDGLLFSLFYPSQATYQLKKKAISMESR